MTIKFLGFMQRKNYYHVPIYVEVQRLAEC